MSKKIKHSKENVVTNSDIAKEINVSNVQVKDDIEQKNNAIPNVQATDNIIQTDSISEKNVINDLKLPNKYEKVKLRPLDLVAFLLILICSIILISAVIYIAYDLISGIIAADFNLKQFFDDKAIALTVGLAGIFGILLIIIIYGGLLLVLTVCILTVIYSIRNSINIGKLLFVSDKDYTKNFMVYRTIKRCFLMLFVSILVAFYFATITKSLNIYAIILGVSGLLLIVANILMIVDLIVAKKKFKASVSEDEYVEVIENKKAINVKYFAKHRHRSNVLDWNDVFRK